MAETIACDNWNAEAARWEAKAKEAQVGMQAEYERQLAQFRTRRDTAMNEVQRLQNASAGAWKDMMQGAGPPHFCTVVNFEKTCIAISFAPRAMPSNPGPPA